MDARGRSLAVWLHGTGLWYAWREPRGRFSRPRLLAAGSSPINFPDEVVALAANGVATAAYRAGSGRIEVRRARPGRPFGPPLAVSDPAAATSPPVVATDDEARAVLTWQEHEEPARRVMAALVSAHGEVSAPQLVGRGQFPTVAMNPSGAAVIAWMDHQARATASVRPPAGDFLPPATLAIDPSDPLAAIDAAGRAVVAGSRLGPAGSNGGTTFAVADQAGSFGEPRRVDHKGLLGQVLAEPDGSVDIVSAYGSEGGVISSLRPDGTLIGPLPLTTPDACEPRVAVARGGALLATWMQSCQIYGPRSRVGVRLRNRLGLFGEPQFVGELSAVMPRAAVTDGDEAIVVYEHAKSKSVHAVVREDRRDAPLPPVPEIDLDSPDEMYLPDLPDIELPVRCPRACSLTPIALLHAGDRAVAGERPRARRLRARRRARLAVPFGPQARQAAEEAAGTGKPVWVSVSVVVRGRSPRPQTITRRIDLRPR